MKNQHSYGPLYCIAHLNSPLASTGAILAVLWRLAAGVVVSVDSCERNRSQGAAQTVASSQQTLVRIWLESCQNSPLRAGRLVRQTAREMKFSD